MCVCVCVGGGGGRGSRVSDFFTHNPNLKERKWGGGAGWVEVGARVSQFFFNESKS